MTTKLFLIPNESWLTYFTSRSKIVFEIIAEVFAILGFIQLNTHMFAIQNSQWNAYGKHNDMKEKNQKNLNNDVLTFLCFFEFYYCILSLCSSLAIVMSFYFIWGVLFSSMVNVGHVLFIQIDYNGTCQTFCYLIKIIMQGHQQTEFTQRDDVIIFSQALASSSHNIKNIKNYRKLLDIAKRNDPIIPNSTECTNDHGYVWTIDHSERITEHHSQQKMRINLDNLPERRASITAGNSRKRNFESLKTQARTMHLTNNISLRQNIATSKKKQPRENKYSFIEKKYNKGPIRDKYLSCWLNSLLIQACHGQKFDMTDDSPALKKYGLDQNSLRSKGIRPQNLTRIYKSLFVYSIGFNDLLKDICDKNMNLRKTIWKVFAILLQYCAQGNFETMIAEIERDKMQKIEMLTGQIKKRQKIIDNNLQINENRNAKIYKQIKQLREDNKNLKHEKQVLLQEFKQAEQAFNQEVSLRLRYENKINQIHGVFCEIQSKHDRLQHDHSQAQKQLEKLRSLTAQQTKAVTDYKTDNQNKTNQMKTLLKQIKFKDQLIGEMEIKKHGDASHIIEHLNFIKDLKMIIEEKNREIGQLNLSMNSTKLLFQTEKREHQQTSISLAASLQENSKLHKTIQQQMIDLNQLLQEKKNFGMKTSQIRAETILSNNKYQEKVRQIKRLEKKVEEYSQQTRNALTQAENEKKLRIQYELDLKVHIDNIKQMKHFKNVIEEKLIEKKRKMQIIDQIIAQKDAEIKQQRQQIDTMTQDLISSKQLIKVLESKLEVLNEKIKSIQDISNKKILALKQQKQKIQRTYMDFSNIKQALQLQRDRLKSKFEQVQIAYKNQKFERTNLNVFYQNSLNTGQEKSQQIKKLDMKISQMRQEMQHMKRQLKNVDYVNGQKQKQYLKEKKQWQERLKSIMQQNKQRKHFIHPMIFEDVSQNFAIQKEYYLQLKKKSGEQIALLKIKIKQKQEELVQLQDRQKNDLMKLTQRYQTALTKKQNQVLYESNKVSHLTQKNKQLEQNLLKFTGHGRQSMSEERQQKYLSDIKQKKVQIQELMKQLQQAHNSNTQLRKNYLQFQTKIPEKEKEVQELRKKIHEVKQHLEQKLEVKQKQYEKKIEQLQQSLIQAKSSGGIKDKNSKYANDKKEQRSGSKDKKYDTVEWNRKDLGSADSKRQDFARKLKGAYIYYKK